MKAFFRNLLATIIGLFLFCFLFIIVIIGIVSIVGGEKEVEIKDNSVLHLKLNKQIVEMSSGNPFEEIDIPLPLGGDGGKMGLLDITKAIEHAKNDKKIKGIYLDLSQVNGGFASVEEIRNKLISFKESGKFIIAYGELISEKAFYLGSVADKIYLYPSGGIEFNGLSTEITFFKGTFDKLGIQPEIFKVGDFKSAVEPFMRENMSDASRLQTTSFLNSLYNHYLNQIAKSMNRNVDELRNICDSMLVRNAADAEKYGLVKLAYYDEVEADIRARLKIEKESEKINFCALKKYGQSIPKESTYKKDKIAVIIAEGEIQSGKSGDDAMGSETIAEEIKKARLDEKVKAIVLRINSPGGSALASDVMWREVELAKKAKPIIASMSDVAASGGYYIAMSCDTIVAYPNTITGSIGVFGMWFNMSDFLKDKLGITTDRVNTGTFSDIGSVTRPLTEYERMAIQKQVEETYDEFTSKAAKGRGMSQDDLKKVASGRVWSGNEAIEKGLVDVLGGLDDAINIAAKAAKLDSNYVVKFYPEKKDFMEEFLKELKGETETYFAEKQYGELKKYATELRKIEQMKGVQTITPIDAKNIE